MSRDFSLRQANPGLEVSVKHRMAHEEDRILLWSADYPAEHIAYNLIDVVQAYAPGARVIEVDET